MVSPYQPITKEDAARILSVSKRTIDNWLADGTIVQPKSIGRRLYWHPDVFYAWLDERLGANGAPCKEGTKGQRIETNRRGRPRATLH